ncbi:Rossmann-fold NAD(P)-binding domain-containing protein [Qiania dongpingensis]|uniref:S-adenosyl-L-homocysteine hydrolase NAD binding domain-containing protein n=1 Tax=Qiania dongpingensis TaxID=2763669 RepID=A0A7G9G3E7_9FIRM|nr:hypothetical protein [Qiania dongpingensis]QNM05329.1 hypothetical protein H9Q78_12965 [Qiania dongpingensis]
MNDAVMPLLESLLSERERAEDTVVLHINHCMENSFYFTEQLKKEFGQVVFVAVPYNDRGVPEGLTYGAYHGIQTDTGYILLRNNRKAEEQPPGFLRAVRRMIALALEHEVREQLEQGRRLLVVEDGGYHYPVLSQWLSAHPRFVDSVLGSVEQTTAGTRASKEGKLLYPAVSVARSAYKVRVESYFVADRVVGELKRMLRRQGSFIDFRDVLLIGYGIIGRSVACCLSLNHVHMQVYDTDAEIRKTAKEDGLTLWDGEFRDDMLVMGNVGKPSFTKEMLEYFLRGTSGRIFLASSSSKQVEFEEVFDLLAGAQRTRLYQADAYRFPGGKELILLAQGFPLNFYDKSSDSLTYGMIDPVFSEMLLSARTLWEQRGRLQNRTYLFGVDEELGGTERETGLLNRWMEMNHLYFDSATFNRHPNEERLREKALGRK